MPPSTPPNLTALLDGESADPKPADLLASIPTLTQLRDKIESDVSTLVANGVTETLLDEVRSTLNVPLHTLLTEAWSTYQTLLPYADPEQHPPGEIALVPLKEHTVTSTHRPTVEVRLDGVPLSKVQFDLEVSLTVEAGVLKIAGGRIHEIQAARVRGGLRLACEGVGLIESETREVEWPGKIELEGGIATAPAAG